MTSSTKGQGFGYYIGLMSGTSADGIDLALLEFTAKSSQPRFVASDYQAYSEEIRSKITSLYQPNNNEIDRAFHLDVALAKIFASAIVNFLKQQNLDASDINAIGNHGQTIRHRPTCDNAFTLQIGCCQTLAALTGIRVIGQFRKKDMALGGQGAPLVPIFHKQLFTDHEKHHILVNIGGIANLTFLPKSHCKDTVLGFDTGPGNALLDDWFAQCHPNCDDNFDRGGQWASRGKVDQCLLKQFMSDKFIQTSAPKSSGREYFNLAWLKNQLNYLAMTLPGHQLHFFNTVEANVAIVDNVETRLTTIDAVDIQATLLAFTVSSIVNAIAELTSQAQIYLCGGGVHNCELVNRFEQELMIEHKGYRVNNLKNINIDADALEAMAFAWLAFAFDHTLVSNMPAVTGASRECTLGCEFLP
jgi:anhydro-N-acetylmuramic acid kinase